MKSFLNSYRGLEYIYIYIRSQSRFIFLSLRVQIPPEKGSVSPPKNSHPRTST